jgi:hypothetical protein
VDGAGVGVGVGIGVGKELGCGGSPVVGSSSIPRFLLFFVLGATPLSKLELRDHGTRTRTRGIPDSERRRGHPPFKLILGKDHVLDFPTTGAGNDADFEDVWADVEGKKRR